MARHCVEHHVCKDEKHRDRLQAIYDVKVRSQQRVEIQNRKYCHLWAPGCEWTTQKCRLTKLGVG